MLLSEAKELLRKNGYRLVEDTDDWDEADMPIGQQDMAFKHNDRRLGNAERITTWNNKKNRWNTERTFKVFRDKDVKVDMSSDALFWKMFLKANCDDDESFVYKRCYADEIKPPKQEGGLWTVTFLYDTGIWDTTEQWSITATANDKGEMISGIMKAAKHDNYKAKKAMFKIKSFKEMIQNADKFHYCR